MKALVLSLFLAGCGAALTPADQASLASYEAEQLACIEAHKPDKAAIDACRAASKSKFCAEQSAKFGAGVCP